MNAQIIDIPIREIRPFVSRARAQAPFERMTESIGEHGIHRPVWVRKIDKPTAEDKKRGYKYERIAGEGRILSQRELGRSTVPAVIKQGDSKEAVGLFLIENLLRKKQTWQQKAKLIASEVGDQKSAISKQELNRIAKKYFITPAHVAKLLRILQQAAPKVRETLDKLTVEEAETLTSLPATGQEIVIETMTEVGGQMSDVSVLVAKAKELKRGGVELSKLALKQSLRRVDEDLARLRQSLKLKRLHFSLGPENVRLLLSDPVFRKALDRRGINYKKFELENAL
jgi:ParB/RepB/Spo0J family partition protein